MYKEKHEINERCCYGARNESCFIASYEGMRLLELEISPKNHAAGNLYITALIIIREQQKKIEILEGNRS